VSDRPQKTEEDHLAEARAALLSAALPQVAFDGWSTACFSAAVADSGVEGALARLACPRGALDLAIYYHRRGDSNMLARMDSEGFASLRYSEKVAALVRFRLEAAEDVEAVRRGVTLFAMPSHAAEGTALIWETSNLIWKALGDTSADLNWYTKRAILSAVYSATLLFWLGDDSDGHQATWEFLDRRIGNVMQFERTKGSVTNTLIFKGFMRGPGKVLERIRAPEGRGRADLPGHLTQKS